MDRITYTIEFLPDDVSLDVELIDPDKEIKDNFILSQIESIIRHNPEDYIIHFQYLGYYPIDITRAIDLIRSSISEKVIFWDKEKIRDTISKRLQKKSFFVLDEYPETEDEYPEIETGRNILIVTSSPLEDIYYHIDSSCPFLYIYSFSEHISLYHNFARSLITRGARSVSYLVFVKEGYGDYLSDDYKIPLEDDAPSRNNEWEEESSYRRYRGTYVQDELGWSDELIDDVLDGEADAYWNID